VVNPFFHTFGYKAGIIACLITGATILPEAVFDPARVLERLLSDGVTVLPGPPALYSALLEGLRMSPEGLLVAGEGAFSGLGLRLAVTGAAVVPVELVRRMREELGCHTVLTAYGLTEATGVVTMCRRGDPPEVVASTSGRAIPGVEVEVRDEGGRAVAPGELGEVVVRGYNVSPGYFEDPAASAEAIDQEGWLHTGDIGVMDEQGNLRICDRLKDMYVVGGFNAYPAEIEQVLVTHPAVASVAVVGVPDERLGEVGAAFVVPRADCDRDGLEESLIEFARSRMANYKVPRRVVVVDALPLNASGKVLKMHLREMAFETGAGRGSAERSNA
jgi:acyl-CoA synthetase (AMP-forming)/AMP-acid ligase II